MAENSKLLFPYSTVRPVQDKLIVDVNSALNEEKDLIVHAPTGIGKTAGVLAPVLTFALQNNKKILFLTSRHTQHTLAIDTLIDIKKAHDINFTVTDIIGKKWMCSQAGIENLYSNEFAEFCKTMKEGGKCEFYNNTKQKGKMTVEAKAFFGDIKNRINHTQGFIDECSRSELCPYEMTLELAAKSDVIIADYYYVFNPDVSKNFFSRIEINLEDVIIVVDEGHNLPTRIMDLATSKLTANIINRAVSEVRKFGPADAINKLNIISDVLNRLSTGLSSGQEKKITKDDFYHLINNQEVYSEIVDYFDDISDDIREKQRNSYVSSVAEFMTSWLGPSVGYARIISKQYLNNKIVTVLQNHCLDPSTISADIIKQAYSTIIMSGTLTPISMYADTLGFKDYIGCEFESPFPEKNRLNLIVPRTTTKYDKRNEEQYKKIAEACLEITNEVPGNSILFFPSYFLRDAVNLFFSTKSKKTVFLETQNLQKEEKEDLLERFRNYKDSGAVMLAVASGSFSEGIDLPGDLLKCVVVIGLPLQAPDLRTKELISYYDVKFKKGWDYGYLFPAFNKAIQSAGRCIRSESDRGVMAFLDERFLWPNYFRCFPSDWKLKIAKLPANNIKLFFENKTKL